MKDQGVTRRDFLKTSTVATIGVSAGLMASGNYAWAAGSDTIRIGLIGCGGRGTGAAINCVESSDGIVVTAMGDLFEDRLDSSRRNLSENLGDAYQVSDDHAFVGWNAFQHVIDSEVDLIILATPPVFRPQHFEAVVKAGKNLFMEKPVAVDVAGVRRVMEAGKLATTKGLSIVTGTQRRHDPKYIETMRRIHAGEMGEVLSGQVYWNQGGLWKVDRKPGMSDVEWQLRNWLYFTWIAGDHIVEQHIHNIDVANWALGGHPVRANGVGGRQVRVDPVYGHVYDHFAIEYEYANGARVLSMCRQQDGTARHVGEFFIGTKGTSDGANYIKGSTDWRWSNPDGQEDVNPYVQEHTDLITSVRAGKAVNETQRMAETNLTAIMGREAAYTGQHLTWEEVINADQNIVPEINGFHDLPVAPVAAPGVTQLIRPPFAHGFEVE